MAELIRDIDPGLVAERLSDIRERVGDGVEVLVATKYVPLEEFGALVEAGVDLVGENRLQDLESKHAKWGAEFTWDFIGNLQSRKVKRILPLVRYIHSVASRSALEQLGKHGDANTRILVEVNLSGEETKGGVQPGELRRFVEQASVEVVGLMTMPPFSDTPEDSRPYFKQLSELARELDLSQLSMGTSQDWPVAVEEGATIIRLGSGLLRP